MLCMVQLKYQSEWWNVSRRKDKKSRYSKKMSLSWMIIFNDFYILYQTFNIINADFFPPGTERDVSDKVSGFTSVDQQYVWFYTNIYCLNPIIIAIKENNWYLWIWSEQFSVDSLDLPEQFWCCVTSSFREQYFDESGLLRLQMFVIFINKSVFEFGFKQTHIL